MTPMEIVSILLKQITDLGILLSFFSINVHMFKGIEKDDIVNKNFSYLGPNYICSSDKSIIMKKLDPVTNLILKPLYRSILYHLYRLRSPDTDMGGY